MRLRIVYVLILSVLASCSTIQNSIVHRDDKSYLQRNKTKNVKYESSKIKKYSKEELAKETKVVHKDIKISKTEKRFRDSRSSRLVEALRRSNKPNLKEQTIEYIDKYHDVAMREMDIHKIPASITLAQGILESGSGKSTLSTKSNNHFGIKCHKTWEGEKVYYDDDAKGECFRKYKKVEQSYFDHSEFLSHRGRYSKLFTYDITNYSKWAHGLKKAGYATDKRYAYKLIDIIRDYRLDEFDDLVIRSYKYKDKAKKGIEKIIDKDSGKTALVEKTTTKTYHDEKQFEKRKERTMSAPSNKKPIIKSNSNKTYEVSEGDTLYSISRKFVVPVNKLIQINNLNNDATIKIGQLLVIN